MRRCRQQLQHITATTRLLLECNVSKLVVEVDFCCVLVFCVLVNTASAYIHPIIVIIIIIFFFIIDGATACGTYPQRHRQTRFVGDLQSRRALQALASHTPAHHALATRVD